MTLEDLRPGMTVRFLLEPVSERLAILALGTIAEQETIHPCSRRTLVPILVDWPAGSPARLVWISSDRILTASTHPTGGFP